MPKPEGDHTPDAFSFTDEVEVPVSTEVTSNAITVSGIDTPALIAVAGGEYGIDGGPSRATLVRSRTGRSCVFA